MTESDPTGRPKGAAGEHDRKQSPMAVAINATERGDYAGALKLFKLIYDSPGRSIDEAPPTGLSYYGLCIVEVEGVSKRAIELAERARKEQFYDAHHWGNLVRIYIRSGSRRRAVAVLEDGLRRMKDDPYLLKVRDEIGYRRPSALRFLHRDNPVNVLFGKNPDLLNPSMAVKTITSVVFLILLFAITFYFLIRNF